MARRRPRAPERVVATENTATKSMPPVQKMAGRRPAVSVLLGRRAAPRVPRRAPRARPRRTRARAGSTPGTMRATSPPGRWRPDDEPRDEEPRPGGETVGEGLRIARGLAPLDARQRRQRGGHHQRAEDRLHDQEATRKPRAAASAESVDPPAKKSMIVDDQVAGQPHGERDQREEVEGGGEEPERLLEESRRTS